MVLGIYYMTRPREFARRLADRENRSDLVGGVTLNDKDDMLAKVLLDLSHNRTIQDSVSLGDDVLAEGGLAG